MGTTRRLLEIGPVAVDVPAHAGLSLFGESRFAAWSDEDLVTVSVGRYSLSVDDRGMFVFREYESTAREEPPDGR